MIIFRIVFTLIFVSILLFLLFKRKKKNSMFWLSITYILILLVGEVLDQIFRIQILNKADIGEIFILEDALYVVVLIQSIFLLWLTAYAFVKGVRSKRKALESQKIDK